MSETPDSEYTDVSVPDEELPEDLVPGDDNPLADTAEDPEAERQEQRHDLGDPHIDGLARDDDDEPVAPDTDASDDAHHGAPDSDD